MALVWLAGSFVLGILAGFLFNVPALPLFIGAGILTASVILFFWRYRRLRMPILCVVCLMVGSGRGTGSSSHWSRRCRLLQRPERHARWICKYRAGHSRFRQQLRDHGPADDPERAHHVFERSGRDAHRGRPELRRGRPDPQFTGLLTTPVSSATVPYRSILANRGIYSELAFPKAFVVGKVSLGLVGFAGQIRTAIENTIQSTMPEPEATFLIALLIGARSAQLGALAPILIQIGLIHLIAISGIKIAIVAGTVHDVLRMVASRTPRLIISTAILMSYWLVSGATVAGLRASIMWLLIFIAAYLGRPTFGLVSLGLAASIMLAFSPALLSNTGFQLTTVATASISMFSPALDRVLGWLPGALRASTTTTLAAQVGVLPIQIASFGIASPVSLLANAIVLPFVPITMAVGFAAVLSPGRLFTTIAYGLVHIMIEIAKWAAGLGTAFNMTALPGPVSLIYYLALGLLAVAAWKLGASGQAPARGEWLFGLCVAAAGLTVAAAAQQPADGISFPVSGSALITWHGEHVLIDGGVKPSALLTALGNALPFPSERLSAIIDTSPDAKNIASLLAVVKTVPTGEAVDPGIEYPSQTYARWRSYLAQKSIPTLALRPGLEIAFHGLTIQAVAPGTIRSNWKDGAGILLIRTPTERILYLGGASATEQQDLPFVEPVKADTIIAAVPIDSTLAAASGYRTVVKPLAGGFISLGR